MFLKSPIAPKSKTPKIMQFRTPRSSNETPIRHQHRTHEIVDYDLKDARKRGKLIDNR